MATETIASPMREAMDPENDLPNDSTDTAPTIENVNDTKPTVVEPPKKRPKLDLTVKSDRKRGKSMFGLLLGTLNKAKLEDKKRNATDAAKKRQLIDQRLQAKIARETESVRRAEETKRDRQMANRKEEELALKDSIQRSRQTRLLHFSNFLCTSDKITDREESPIQDMEMEDDGGNTRPPKPSIDPLAPPPRSHPPPLYFSPSILLPSQHTFLEKRKEAVKDALQKEQAVWLEERKTGIAEVVALRAKVQEEEERERERAAQAKEALAEAEGDDDQQSQHDQEMEIEEEKEEEVEKSKPKARRNEPLKDKESTPPPSKSQNMDEDDAVEY